MDFSFKVEASLRSQGRCDVVHVAVFSSPFCTLTSCAHYWRMICGVVSPHVLMLHRGSCINLRHPLKKTKHSSVFPVCTQSITCIHKQIIYRETTPVHVCDLSSCLLSRLWSHHSLVEPSFPPSYFSSSSSSLTPPQPQCPVFLAEIDSLWAQCPIILQPGDELFINQASGVIIHPVTLWHHSDGKGNSPTITLFFFLIFSFSSRGQLHKSNSWTIDVYL